MGREVESQHYTREQRQEYRRKVQTNLDVLATMLSTNQFTDHSSMTGVEIELNLVDENLDPHFQNTQVLEAIADPNYVTELAKYNIELNVRPRTLPGRTALELEEDLRESLNRADAHAREVGSSFAMMGILPTLREEHFESDWISANNRYTALNDSIFFARGEDVLLDIEGPTGERVRTYADSIAPESACTSVQLHLQVPPQDFAAHWNAAQVLCAVQVAVGANSPFFFGKRLHAETRVEVFKQATDTRPIELVNQGVRPRVFFGERWITSIFDLFEENVRFFPVLLAEVSDEDPVAVLAGGGAPQLAELRLHNGTVYRWNRPIYDVVDSEPHLRIENRVLPAGPTIIDTLANAAFYYGTMHILATEDRPVWSRLSFEAAEDNFNEAAVNGLDARLYWPGHGLLNVDELVLRRLLPMAHEGLRRFCVDDEVRERYLGVIEQRCTNGQNGAAWQVAAVEAYEKQGKSRDEALKAMLGDYMTHMHSNEPVHTWPLPE